MTFGNSSENRALMEKFINEKPSDRQVLSVEREPSICLPRTDTAQNGPNKSVERLN